MKKVDLLRMVLVLVVQVLFICDTRAQYFGRNKAQYRDFDFKVLHSPHFELYHYFKGDSLAQSLANQSERWYQLHQHIFKDTIKYKNPLVFYEDHADFQQTTVISGLIGVGTGGVTEGLKNRVVMPVMETQSQTHHVLGHELVHAFQYNLLKSHESLSINNIRNLPLWMVEGMAEYLSIGKTDANTAMWMRDAVLNKDIPSIKDLTRSSKYFPYRYGQAFWAFVGSVWGDSTIMPLFYNTARYGLETAVDSVLRVNTKTLSNMWKSALENHYKTLMIDSVDRLTGTRLISLENAGRINVSPSLSPNGNYLMFLSEKDLFTIDLYLADARSGKILRKISSANRSSHIDALSYIETAGSWSPDSRHFVFTAFSKGQNKLLVIDAIAGRIEKEIFIPEVKAFSNPAWSPDGDYIVVTGLVNGQSDLYLYELKRDRVTRLTYDVFSDIHPGWSPDGRTIVFASDRLQREQGNYTFNISMLDLSHGKIASLDLFPGADNLNPVFTADGKGLLFLSNRDGFRNIYRYDLGSEEVFQLTSYLTGVSGITPFAPAISVSQDQSTVAYSYYFDQGYSIYLAPQSLFEEQPVDPQEVDFSAATLAPKVPDISDLVGEQLKQFNEYPLISADSFRSISYQPKFKLDYIGNTTIGVSTSRFGTGLQGGVNMLFSDMLGNNQLFAGLALNGEIRDFGGQVAYLNQEHKINWGAAISHIPYRTGALSFSRDTLLIENDTIAVDNIALNVLRTFEDQVNLFGYYPISQTRRLELGTSFSRYSFHRERFNNYYFDGFRIGQDRQKLEAPDGFTLWNLNAAYVGDNSFFGIASPFKGHRFRLQVEKYYGEVDFYSALIDYRKYHYMKPVSVGFRVYHNARYGNDAESNRISPLFIGYPTLIRGYEDVNFRDERNLFDNTVTINDLIGSRVLVSNLEVRLPFSGPERLSMVKSQLLFTELALFFDGGLAWNSGSRVRFNSEKDINEPLDQRAPVFSAGLSLRLNLFGQLVIEPYYAIPFQRNDVSGGVFGVNFAPGW